MFFNLYILLKSFQDNFNIVLFIKISKIISINLDFEVKRKVYIGYKVKEGVRQAVS